MIYLRPGTRLKSYSSNTKNDKTLIRIEIETDDHMEAGFLMRDLQEMKREQEEARKPKPSKPKAKPPVLALPAPLLMIPHFDDSGAAE